MLKRKDVKAGKTIKFNGETLTLIQHEPSLSRSDRMPYIHEEREDGVIINATSERWLVTLPDGFRTHRYIHFYHSKGEIPAECEAWRDDVEED